jgi:LysM repeat protein
MMIFGSLGFLNNVKAEQPYMRSFLNFLLEEDKREIKKGDTFYRIAKDLGVSVDDITKANPELDPTKLQIGQSINLPGSKKKKPELTGLARFAADLKPYEGFRAKRYLDHKGNPTVGYGHMIGPDSKKRFEAAGIGDQYQGVCVAGVCGLSEKDAEKLLQQDIKNIYEPRTRKLLPKFDQLNPEAQSAAVGSVYRGGLSGSPKTVELLQQGKFEEAGKEFLDSKEYRESKKQGTGVHKRMEKYADAFSRASYTEQ